MRTRNTPKSDRARLISPKKHDIPLLPHGTPTRLKRNGRAVLPGIETVGSHSRVASRHYARTRVWRKESLIIKCDCTTTNPPRTTARWTYLSGYKAGRIRVSVIFWNRQEKHPISIGRRTKVRLPPLPDRDRRTNWQNGGRKIFWNKLDGRNYKWMVKWP